MKQEKRRLAHYKRKSIYIVYRKGIIGKRANYKKNFIEIVNVLYLLPNKYYVAIKTNDKYWRSFFLFDRRFERKNLVLALKTVTPNNKMVP